MKILTLLLKKSYVLAILFVLFFVMAFRGADEGLVFIQSTLNKYHDAGAGGSTLKRYELNVTENAICKYRRIYANGKIEFFSLNITRLKSMAYYGTTLQGELHLFTKNDDVIVQTHNDRKGNVDSMARQMIIPLKGIEPEVLNQLSAQLSALKK